MATTDRFLPFVQETSSTTGTGTLTLAGAVSGYRTFLSAFGGSAIAMYTLANSDYSKWEVGYGTVSGATLTRNLLASSTGALVDFTGSTPFNVYIGSAALGLNSMLRWHFGSSRPGWLPANAPWMDDLGSSLLHLKWYDGTDDVEFPFLIDSSNNVGYHYRNSVRQAESAVVTTAGAASIVSNSWPSWANMVEVQFDLIPATDAVSLSAVLQTGAGTDYTSAGYNGNLTYGAGASVTAAATASGTAMGMGGNIDNNAAYGGVSGFMKIYNLQDTRSRRVTFHHTYYDSSNQLILMGGYTVSTTAATTGVKFSFSSGNVASGSRLTATWYP